MTAPNNKPVPKELMDRFRAYHDKNSTWGSVHIVLDDGNIRDHHCQSCVDYAKETGDAEGQFLAEQLLKMSKSQRYKVAAKC